MKEWIRAAVAGVMLAGATAASAQVTQELYGQVGTEGVGIGYGHVLGSMLNARAEVNGFALSHNINSGGLNYNGTLDLAHAGLYLDFFPLPSIVPFRLTAGVLIGGDALNLTSQPESGTYTISGHTYSAQGEQITAKASYPTLRPYVGIGLGHSPIATRGWGLFFDAGVAYGQPQLDFSAPSAIVAEGGQAALNTEEQQLANTIDRYRFYPIVKIGATYRF
jgi:hypothetical protein